MKLTEDEQIYEATDLLRMLESRTDNLMDAVVVASILLADVVWYGCGKNLGEALSMVPDASQALQKRLRALAGGKLVVVSRPKSQGDA